MPGTDPLKPLHILLAEDDSDDHVLFAEALTSFNLPYYKLSRVRDGEEAINFLVRQGRVLSDTSSVPDFIVLDINMPKMDGYQVLRRFKELTEFQKVPVYVLTTSTQPETKDRCTQLGAAAFYQKPAARSELLAIIREMLDKFKESRK